MVRGRVRGVRPAVRLGRGAVLAARGVARVPRRAVRRRAGVVPRRAVRAARGLQPPAARRRSRGRRSSSAARGGRGCCRSRRDSPTAGTRRGAGRRTRYARGRGGGSGGVRAGGAGPGDVPAVARPVHDDRRGRGATPAPVRVDRPRRCRRASGRRPTLETLRAEGLAGTPDEVIERVGRVRRPRRERADRLPGAGVVRDAGSDDRRRRRGCCRRCASSEGAVEPLEAAIAVLREEGSRAALDEDPGPRAPARVPRSVRDARRPPRAARRARARRPGGRCSRGGRRASTRSRAEDERAAASASVRQRRYSRPVKTSSLLNACSAST